MTKQTYEIIIRCDLTEENYIYNIEAESEDEAFEEAREAFCSDYLNLMTREDYIDCFEEEPEENEGWGD